MKNKIILFVLLIISTSLNAQTGGPGQPEFMQFKPATATDLVNPTSGSFSYNISLFDVGGYPVNLSYQSGITMEDVASIVGLGWNINIGAITHTVRGIPDDFDGDIVTRNIFMKPNITYGGNIGIGIEIAGLNVGGGLNAGMGIFYNNYNGYGAEESFGLSFSLHKEGSPGATIGLGMKANSQSGVDIYAKPSVSMKLESSSGLAATGSLGGMISVNSREGLKTSVNASMDLSQNTTKTHKTGYLARNENNKLVTKYKSDPVKESLLSASAAYSFSKTPEIPRVTYPFKTKAYSGSFKAGGEIYFIHPHGELSGYYTSQELSTNKISTPAYGFLYSDKSYGMDNVLLDYNREKDQPYIKDASINIGIPFFTNDIYTVNAQGIGGSFQLNRGDIGVIYDNKVLTSGTSVNLGIEMGVGAGIHMGAALSTTFNSSSSGKWDSDITPHLAFKGESPDTLYQSAYFKNASDVSVDANGLYDSLKGDKPVEVKINDANTWGKEVRTTSNLVLDDDDLNPILPGNYLKTIRDPRTINIQFLTAAQASVSGLERNIKEYPVNTFDCSQDIVESDRITVDRKGHHISEMTSTNTDGMRYVFGLPTYNIIQKEVSFTLESSSTPGNDGLVNYSNHRDWGDNGKDGFYESTELPPYVTSNLLTAVLSPDYIDVDVNGPSINDVGNYVKMNYSKAGTYKWRTPYEKDKATFNKAFLSDQTDNKASYVYGEKELWYTHSIESKTEIAEFYYDINGRKDGVGVIDTNGGKDTSQKLYKLDSIKVYSINERVLKGSSAVPIRIIYFSYDYELCKNIINSTDNSGNSGKLTLKKVSFASGKSKRELLSPYRFEYGKMSSSTVINPDYNPRNVNRFGNYQENKGSSDINIDSTLSNIDFPYASQDITEMNKNSYAWNLTDITLPGSGTINIQYEPHRYAYTQDQRCMQMFPMQGSGILYTSAPEYTIKFKLEKPINGSNAYEQLLYKYFNNDLTKFFYYKALVNLKPGIPEWISGYCKIKSIAMDGTDYASIILEPVSKNDKGTDLANPIAKNAWQFMRMNRPEICYGNSTAISGLGLQAFLLNNPFGKVSNQIEAFRNVFNNYAAENSFAASLEPSKSFFRLYSPSKNKIIGGSRVKRIVTDDNWSKETDESSESKSYTIDYEYIDSVANPVTGKIESFSSGVMEYEPFNGQDENPLRYPLFINQHIKMAPDNRLFVETPFNESLFPASNLIYSKVKIISNKTDLNVPGQGYQEIESFTAKDYPVYIGNTNLGDNHEQKSNPFTAFALSILGVSKTYDYITLSQGFSIILNDMHGKQKTTSNYNSNGALISSEHYKYKIGSELNLIDGKNNIYSSNNLGIGVTAICDSRTTEHFTKVIGINANFDIAFPMSLIIPKPDISEEKSKINTVVFNKIVTKKGILTKKTVTENGAAVSTENILFDDKTGYVVLSKTTNEFDDPLYKFHYPAHWIYEGLGAGYISSDLEFSVQSISNNYFTVTHEVFDALAVGDEIVSAGSKYWITAKGTAANTTIKLESSVLGAPVTITTTGKVLRSGRRNQLLQEAGSVVSLVNPIDGNHINFSELNSNAKIINVSMQEFSDNRVKYCDCDSSKDGNVNNSNTSNNVGTVISKPDNIRAGKKTIKSINTASNSSIDANNPYAIGERGNWYPQTTWSYLTDRERSVGFNSLQTNIRADGSFTDYKNFWKYVNGSNPGWRRFTSGWQWVETVTKKDVNGLTLETSDILGRHNALLTGYKNKLVVAEAGNARINEILFDGFEDWNYLAIAAYCDNDVECMPKIVEWNGVFVQDTQESHSGKYSGKLVGPGQIINIPVIPAPLVTEVSETEGGNTTRPTPPTCTGTFKPTAGKKYVVSAWVRDAADPIATNFDDPVIKVGSSSFQTSGNIIDGWQRIYGEFIIPLAAASLNLSFGNGSGNTWFDDIRIFPFDAKIITHVYDGNTQKLTFTSDENNYFTKYNYDAADNLESINQETEKGVQTIKEARSATVKLP